jgi:hypothetical protein
VDAVFTVTPPTDFRLGLHLRDANGRTLVAGEPMAGPTLRKRWENLVPGTYMVHVVLFQEGKPLHSTQVFTFSGTITYPSS